MLIIQIKALLPKKKVLLRIFISSIRS